MKKNLIAVFVALIVMSSSIYAQAVPPYFNFYGKAMNGSNPVTAPFSVSVTINSFQGGPALYHEVFNNVQADAGGMYKLEIGSGITTDNWYSINWGATWQGLSIAIDPNNGTSYGTPSYSSLLSVPFSLVAEKSISSKFTNGNAGYVPKFNSPTEIISSSIYDSGNNVGIGCLNLPDYSSKLHVKGNGIIGGYFTNDLTNSAARAIKAEYLGTGYTDAIAVEGISKPKDYYGYGGKFTGGYIGVKGFVQPTGNKSYHGVFGEIYGGVAGKAGYGVYGISSGIGSNYGIYGSASGGTVNYAGYFAGNVNVSGIFTNVSDMKFKSDIQPISNSLSTLMKLEPKTYSFKTKEFKSMNLPEGKHYGFVAQELEKIMPELVTNNIQAAEYNEKKEKTSDEIKFKAVNYIEMISLLVASVQEQEKIIEKMQMEIEKLKQTNPIKK